MKHYNSILVKGACAPTVEIDTEVASAYVRFKSSKVAKTVSRDQPGAVVAIDFDASNEVVGIELIGVHEFTLTRLLKLARVKAPHADLNKPRYVRAGNLQPA
jgi:uncharacterized protein YuzE